MEGYILMISILCFEIVNGLSDGKIMKSKDYSKNILPGKKVDVKLSTYLASILEVDEEKQTLSFELSLRMMWKPHHPPPLTSVSNIQHGTLCSIELFNYLHILFVHHP